LPWIEVTTPVKVEPVSSCEGGDVLRIIGKAAADRADGGRER
jgi:hypothetical protein